MQKPTLQQSLPHAPSDGLSSLQQIIDSALVDHSVKIGLSYRGLIAREPNVMVDSRKARSDRGLSTLIQAGVREWVSLAIRHRLPIIGIYIPMIKWPMAKVNALDYLRFVDIDALRADLATIFRDSGRIMQDDDYIDLLVRLGVSDGHPAVYVTGFGDDRLSKLENLQTYSRLVEFVRANQGWFTGISTLDLTMSLDGQERRRRSDATASK